MLKARHTGNVVLTVDHLKKVLDHFSKQEAFAFDVETMGAFRGVPTQNNVVWLSMATAGMSVAIPMGHPNGDVLLKRATRKKNRDTGKFDMFPPVYDEPPTQLSRKLVFDILRPLFFNEDIVKIAHNAQFDLISISKYYDGKILPGKKHDTIVLQHLLDENLRSKKLKDLIIKYWQVKYDFENVGRQIEIHPFSTVGHYAYMDAKYTYFLWTILLPLIEKRGLQEVFELELNNGSTGVIDVICEMGRVGAPVDISTLENLRVTLSAELEDIETRVYQAAGKHFNINSTPQKAELLYGPASTGGQGLKVLKRTDTGNPSTDSEALEKHVGNPLVDALNEYAEISKILSTYVIGYLGEDGNPKKPCNIFNGRVHTELVQYGTVTGRFSSRNPNLQNVPNSSTPLGKQLRSLFIAKPGYSLVVADYGQIEMFLLAHYIGYGALFEGVKTGMDPHSATGAKLIGMDPEEFMRRKAEGDPIIKAARSVAKGVNFAIVYGAGPDKVASMAGITLAKAKEFLKIHQKEFPEIYKFKTRVIDTCRSRKPSLITTLMGRKRRLPTIHSKDNDVRAQAERQAVNSLIQGSAADVIKKAMIHLFDHLPDDMQMLLSVHDELVVMCPTPRIDACKEAVHEAMLGEHILGLLQVPLDVDIEHGDSWGAAK